MKRIEVDFEKAYRYIINNQFNTNMDIYKLNEF
jgi:hypothetical protein